MTLRYTRNLVPMQTRIVYMAAALSAACSAPPPYHELPMQRAAVLGSEPRILADAISVDSQLAERHILSGVLPGGPGSQWLWANQRVELRFQVMEKRQHHFYADFVIAESTFKSTGPVTMRFFVKGKPVGEMRCDTHGRRHFEAVVPEAMIEASEIVPASMEVDKTWTSTDNAKLGFLFIGAGFKD